MLGDEPIYHNGAVVGWVTSGGYGHFVKKSLAQGYIPANIAKKDSHEGSSEFEVDIIGKKRKAIIAHEPLFDPEGRRMRM